MTRLRWTWLALGLWPALAGAQGRALGPDPAQVWEGHMGYAATAASLLQCSPSEECAGGQNCQGLNSATATLDVIPETPTLRLVHAQLNWVASLPPDGTPDEHVTLVPPGGQPVDVAYDPMMSEQFDDALDAQSCELIGFVCPAAEGNCGLRFYSYHADVTQALQAHRDGGGTLNGQWTVRDVDVPGASDGDPATAVAAIAGITIGGWSLLVVYEDEDHQPLRRIYYYQGFELDEGENRTVHPRGFLAPADPTVDLTFFVLEGDEEIQGDKLTVNGQEVSDGCNPNRNVFNSTVNTGRSDGMCQRGVQGVDLDRFVVRGAINPGDDHADVTYVLPMGDGLITQGEQMFTDWLILAFDHRLPNFETLKPEKQAQPPSGSTVAAGDPIDYVIVVQNTGGDFATHVVITDDAPPGTHYVAGSTVLDRMAVADNPGGGLPLAAGLDLATVGIDRVAPQETHTVRFRVTVDANAHDGTEITNVASIAAAEVDPAMTDPVTHFVGQPSDGGPPPPDAATDLDASRPPPRRDAGEPPPDFGAPRDAGFSDDAFACPPGQMFAPRGGACIPLSCADGSVLQDDQCVGQPSNPCGPGTKLAADGSCVSICGPGLKWDYTCPGGGQCRQQDDPPCHAESGGASDGCGCDYTDAPPALAPFLLPLLAVLRPRRRR
jgi:uncharacterized repeat protein (TIGR01451 family)/uncharacterized protein (TIGR03382 family)